jgi:hypothetical protein
MYLPDDKNDSSPTGNETRRFSRKLDVLIEKFCIPWVSVLFRSRESKISLRESEDSLQSMNSSDVNVSLFWFRSLQIPLI